MGVIVPVGYDVETGKFVPLGDDDELEGLMIRNDLFGRVQVAQPETLISSKHRYNTSPFQLVSDVANGGTVTHLPNQSAVSLNVTTTSGSRVYWQTKHYIPYQPGKAQGIDLTWIMAGLDANRRFRCGTFDAQNGVFLQVSGASGDMAFVVRDYVDGSARDTSVSRTNWNVDKFDGLGPSGLTFSADSSAEDAFDILDVQIFVINYQWLAAGTVEFGFFIDGRYRVAHRQHHANRLRRVYMSTACLPIRFEIENTGAASAVGSFTQICSEIHSSGGSNLLHTEGIPGTIGNVAINSVAGLALNANNRKYLCAIRLKTSFNSVRNAITVVGISPWFNALARTIWFGVLYSPAESPSTETGGSWVSVDSFSGVEYNTTLTDVTPSANSKYMYQNVIDANGSAEEIESLLSSLHLSLNIAGNASDTIYLAVQRLEANNTTVWGGFNWKEIQ